MRASDDRHICRPGATYASGLVDEPVAPGDGARLASGKELTYTGVNLCETNAVTLNRRADGTTWIDYD